MLEAVAFGGVLLIIIFTMNKLDRIRVSGTNNNNVAVSFDKTIRNNFNTQTIMKGQTYV